MGVSELNVIGLIIIAAQSTPGFAPNMKFQRHKIKPPEQATTAGISDMICIYNIPGNKVEPAIAPLMQCRCCARCFCSRASRETKEICPEPVGGGANTPRTRVFFEDLSDIYSGHHWTNTSPCQAIWLHKSIQQRQEVVPRRFFVPYSRWTKRSNPSKPPGPKFHCCTKLYIASLALGFFFGPPAARPKGNIKIWGCRGANNTAGVWFHRPSTVRGRGCSLAHIQAAAREDLGSLVRKPLCFHIT